MRNPAAVSDSMCLMELQLALLAHCRELRRVTAHLAAGRLPDAVRMLDRTTSALHAKVERQVTARMGRAAVAGVLDGLLPPTRRGARRR